MKNNKYVTIINYIYHMFSLDYFYQLYEIFKYFPQIGNFFEWNYEGYEENQIKRKLPAWLSEIK